MSFLVETSCLTAAVRLLHRRVALLVALLRWLFAPPFLPSPLSGVGAGGPSRAQPNAGAAHARVVKDNLRVSTYGEVARALRCGDGHGHGHGGGGGGGGAEKESCAVCLGELRRRDKVRVPSNCRHVYHLRCLDRWLDHDEQGTCPLCRAPLLAASSPVPPPQSRRAAEHRGAPHQQPSWAVEQLLYFFGDDLLPPAPSSSPYLH